MAKLLLISKTFYFMVKPIPLGKTFVFHGYAFTSWQNPCTSCLNLYLSTKPFYFKAQLLPLGKTSFFFG
jgi:hypothetical protein